MSLLINTTPFAITYANGLKDTIEIKQLSIRELYKFIEFVRDNQTFSLVELCCARNGAWIDSLDIDSYGALAAKCISINFQRAVTIAKSDPVAATRLAPTLVAIGATLQSLEPMAKSMPPSAPTGPTGASPSPTPSS